MRDNSFRLLTLGRLALVDPHGSEDASISKRRRKLALCAVLAMAERPMSREALVGLFWEDQDEARARHSLSDALSHLRRILGRDALTTRQSEVSLAEGAPLAVDAVELAAAAAARDYQRTSALYRGPFFDGVHLGRSPRLEHWVERERARLQSLFLQGCERQCLVLARARRWEECADLAGRWLDAAPLSSSAALFRLNALKAPGGPEADRRALEDYERLAARIARDHRIRPDPTVVALAEDIAARVAAAPVVSPAMAVAPPAATEPTPAPASAGSRIQSGAQLAAALAARRTVRRAARRARWVGGVAAVLALIVTGVVTRRDVVQATPSRPVLAIAGFQSPRADSSSSWMSEGLSQMIAAKLARATTVDIVAPQRVRELRMRARSDGRDSLAVGELLDIGRRLGATWVVSGGVSGGGNDSALVLDLEVHDVATGKREQLYAISAANLLALADRAASRLLDAAGARGSGPHLAEAETASLEAYEHYVRSFAALSEGRAQDGRVHLDAAIALDSGFIGALRERLQLAFIWGERDVLRSLTEAMRKHQSRVTDWDRLYVAAFGAFRNGEHTRSEALGRALVERYPNDPRAYALLGNIYFHHGRWDEAERVMRSQLAIDSLAAMAGNGICVPCGAYSALAAVLMERGDMDGAERVVRRLLELQPDLGGAWNTLSAILAAQGRFDASMEAQRRAIVLTPGDAYVRGRLGRNLIIMRRYAEADSVIGELSRDSSADVRKQAYDLRFMLQRELGQFRASSATIDAMLAEFPDTRELQLVQGNNLGRVGDYRGARRVYETLNHTLLRTAPSSLPAATPLAGDYARAFCWQHTLAADAISAGGDTVLLRVLADSIQQESGRSYYARDWSLHHHVRGLIAMRQGRYEEAVSELEQARWGGHGYTRTLAELARAQLALGRPRDAIATLRAVYLAPLDAMGRYLPRSEADFLMWRAFEQSGMPDSAAVYEAYVRNAWAEADPEVRTLVKSFAPPEHQ